MFFLNSNDFTQFFTLFSNIRVNKTEFNETTLVAIVKKYGRGTLVEEVEGRLEHTVTIQQKTITRSKRRMSDFQKFSYHCTCVAEKAMCIHIAVLLLSEFIASDEA